MKNLLIIALIISNIIHFCLSDKNNTKLNKVTIGNTNKAKSIEKILNNSTESISNGEENIRATELKRKNNNYWILFLILFSLSFLSSGLYVHQDVLFRKHEYNLINDI